MELCNGVVEYVLPGVHLGFFAAAILLTLLLLSLMMVALRSRPEPHSLFELSRKLQEVEGVDCRQISHARN